MPEITSNKLDKHPDTLYPENHPGKTRAPASETGPAKQPESIMLVTKTGNTSELTAAKLDKWFSAIETRKYGKEDQPSSDELITTQLLSRFGIKNSAEVLKFLKSPAGESVIALIGDQLAELASIEEYQRAEMLEAHRRHERMIAFLLLALFHKHDAKAKSLNEFIQHQIDKALKKSTDTSTAAQTEARKILERQYDTLEESAKYLESLLGKKNLELDALQQERLALQQEGIFIEERHTILQSSAFNLDNDADFITLDPANAHHYLTNRIQVLNMAFEENSRQISALEAENKPHEARKLLHRNHGLRLHIDGLADLHAIHRKEKVFYTKNGEETDSHRDAAFVLKPDLKIARDSAGLRYLIGARQNLADMDETMKAQARNRYEALKPEIYCIKNLITHQCKREKNYHRNCVHSLDNHIECREKELTLIKNQHHHIKAAQANVLAEMRKLNPDLVKANNMQKALPNVASGMSVNKVASSPDLMLRQSMNALQKNPTQQNINNVANNLTNIYGRVPVQIREDLNKIIPGRPIPEVLLRSLNRSIYRIKMASDTPELTPEPKSNPSWPPKPSPYK